MKCWDMKHILALPTCQKICSDKEPEQIDFRKFDLGHPVVVPNGDVKMVDGELEPIGDIVVMDVSTFS